jgi:hypothetical protein
MHHFSFVRADIGSKMRNVSNRDNHDGAAAFLRDFEHWTPEVSGPAVTLNRPPQPLLPLPDALWAQVGVIHPHPWGRKVFQFVSRVPNRFGVDLSWVDAVVSS